MGYIALILTLILVYVAVSYARFRANVTRGIEIGKYAVPFERRIPAAEKRILFAGDSTVVGMGAQNPTLSTAGRCGADHPNAEIINLGKNGRRLAEMVETIRSEKERLGKFDIAVFQIGANDVTHLTPLPEVEKSLKELLEEVAPLAPKILILHSGDLGRSPIFPWPISWIISARTRAVRDIYLRIVPQSGAHYVDLYGAKVDDEFHTDKDRFYATDYFHLSGDGYGIWYRETKKVLGSLK